MHSVNYIVAVKVLWQQNGQVTWVFLCRGTIMWLTNKKKHCKYHCRLKFFRVNPSAKTLKSFLHKSHKCYISFPSLPRPRFSNGSLSLSTTVGAIAIAMTNQFKTEPLEIQTFKRFGIPLFGIQAPTVFILRSKRKIRYSAQASNNFYILLQLSIALATTYSTVHYLPHYSAQLATYLGILWSTTVV